MGLLEADQETVALRPGASSAERSSTPNNAPVPNSRSTYHGRNFSRACPNQRQICLEPSLTRERHRNVPRSL
jgi:hypothetical protein